MVVLTHPDRPRLTTGFSGKASGLYPDERLVITPPSRGLPGETAFLVIRIRNDSRSSIIQLFIYCPVAFINMKVKPEDSLKIENIVASAKVTDYLDLPSLASQIKDAEYNKKRFPGVVIRMQNPKIAALVFGSGKVVLTGAKSIESLSEGLEILGNLLRDLQIDIPQKLTYKIQNIVTSADLGSGINLNKIAVGFNLDRIEYEPEQFPGLVYRLENPKVVVLLFGSGKLIITGGKVPEDAKRAVQKILNDLKNLGLL